MAALSDCGGRASDCTTTAVACDSMTRTALPDGMLGAGSRCEAASLKAAGKDVAAGLRCYAKAAAKGESVDGARTAKAQARFVAAFDRTAGCTADGHAAESSEA